MKIITITVIKDSIFVDLSEEAARKMSDGDKLSCLLTAYRVFGEFVVSHHKDCGNPHCNVASLSKDMFKAIDAITKKHEILSTKN